MAGMGSSAKRSFYAHVDHILVAEFDIDRGAMLSHQIPVETAVDPSALAELMLPDGAHLREEDWTMFFLNHKIPGKGENVPVIQRSRKAVEQAGNALVIDAYGYVYDRGQWRTAGQKPKVALKLEDKEMTVWNGTATEVLFQVSRLSKGTEYRKLEPLCVCVFFDGTTLGIRFANIDDEVLFLNHCDKMGLYKRYTPSLKVPRAPPLESGAKPLLYVQNLVLNKVTDEARRGAKVMAMAVASRHPWAYVYKPLLLVALEKYMAQPSEDILYNLYDAINAVDLSFMPRLTIIERNILRASEDKSMFEEKFLEMEERSLARQQAIGEIEDTFLTLSAKDRHFFDSTIEFEGDQVPIRIPLGIFPEEIGDFSVIQFATTFSALDAVNKLPPGAPQFQWKNGSPYYWHPHLDSGASTHPIMLILNALLTQKRVVFLGHQRSSGEVANYVLAACAIASGGGSILKGFAERCFPYAGLSNVDTLLAIPGFIAGVTNPIFEEQASWWDVLCNINTGRITVSTKIETVDTGVVIDNKDYTHDSTRDWMKTGSWEGDDDFIGEVVYAIQSQMGELYVRQKFYEFVQRFIDVTAAYELESIGTTGIGLTPINTGNADLGLGAYFPDEAMKRKEMLMIRNRMEGWRSTRSYLHCQKDFQVFLKRRPIKELDLRHVSNVLRASGSLDDSTVVRLFLTLHDHIVSEKDDALLELLSYMPQNQGGLMPIAVGLIHPRWEVRRACTRILWRLDWHKVGTRFNQNLNPFFRLAYTRSSRNLLMAAEKPAYLDDPDFVDENIATSPSESGLNDRERREKARDTRKKETRKSAARMSTMFEAKNANRLVFKSNNAPEMPSPRQQQQQQRPPAWMEESRDFDSGNRPPRQPREPRDYSDSNRQRKPRDFEDGGRQQRQPNDAYDDVRPKLQAPPRSMSFRRNEGGVGGGESTDSLSRNVSNFANEVDHIFNSPDQRQQPPKQDWPPPRQFFPGESASKSPGSPNSPRSYGTTRAGAGGDLSPSNSSPRGGQNTFQNGSGGSPTQSQSSQQRRQPPPEAPERSNSVVNPVSSASASVQRMVAAQEAKAAEVRRKLESASKQPGTVTDLSAIAGHPGSRYDASEIPRFDSLSRKQQPGSPGNQGSLPRAPPPMSAKARGSPSMDRGQGSGGGSGGPGSPRVGNSSSPRTPRQQYGDDQ